jgi:hypothetical protein
MIKKLLIAGVFVGGGIFFIKKILPKITNKTDDYDISLVDVDSLVLDLSPRERWELFMSGGMTKYEAYQYIDMSKMQDSLNDVMRTGNLSNIG